MNYQYPIQNDWSTEEVVDVIAFLQAVEIAYEKGVEREVLIQAYRRFKDIVPSKSEEKTLTAEFEKSSGYSCYQTMKKVKESSEGQKIKM